MKKKITFVFLLGFLCFNLAKVNAQETEEKLHHVIWENEIGVNIQGNEIAKTTSQGWNAGMFSRNKLSSNQNGRIEHKVQDQSKYYMFGLSTEDKNAHYNTINYAWYVRPSYAYIYINGRYTQRLGGKIGEVLEIEKEDNIILFKKDGVVVYKQEHESEEQKPFFVDVSIYKTGTFKFEVNATFEPHYIVNKWRSKEGVTISGSRITKTGSTGWNADFFSEGKISKEKDGFIEHEVINQSRYYMVGLSSKNENSSYKTINYAWYVRPGRAYIYRDGNYQGYYGSSVGDKLRIERIGSMLYMKMNNITMRTYTTEPEEELHIDASFYQAGTYDVPIEASFSNPISSYAILKKKLDGSCQVVDGDIKFKFIQEYAITTGLVLECKVYDWQRNMAIEEDLNPNYGVNWFSIPTDGLSNNETYTLEFEGNKGQKYFLKFKYKNQSEWDSLEENESSEQ
jgi:hypothetical protein